MSKTMHIILKSNIFLLLSVSMIFAKDSPNNWHSYWLQSGKAFIMDESNQWLLGSAAIVALGATQIDMKVKDYVQSHKILSDPISHFGDEMGGNWGHWILWSSIITSSKIKKESNKKFMSKIQSVRGTHDLVGSDYLLYNHIRKVIFELADNYDYNEIETPIFESSELFKKPLGEFSDVVLKEMYSFEDRNKSFLTLRPEYTLPMIRAAITNNLFNHFYNCEFCLLTPSFSFKDCASLSVDKASFVIIMYLVSVNFTK
mgnify:CR=1 FL=1